MKKTLINSKFLILTHTYPPATGGIANVVQKIAHYNPFDDVFVAYLDEFDCGYKFDEDKIKLSGEPDKNITLLPLWSKTKSKLFSLLTYFWLNIFGLVFSIKNNIKVVYFSLSYPVSVMAPIYRCFGINYIVHVHGSELFKHKSRFLRLYNKIIFKYSKKIIATSSWTKYTLLQFGVKKEKIIVVYPRVEPEKFLENSNIMHFKKQENLIGKKILLTVAHIIYRKGQHLVIRALPELLEQYSNLVYVVVGVGPDIDKLKQMAKELKVEKNVLFPGNRDQVNFFHACDVFVMPSLYVTQPKGDIESFGIVFIEANLCKKPVIGSNNGGMPESILNGKTGLLIETENIDDLISKIKLLLEDEDYAHQLGMQGYRRALNEFTPATLSKELRGKVFD